MSGALLNLWFKSKQLQCQATGGETEQNHVHTPDYNTAAASCTMQEGLRHGNQDKQEVENSAALEAMHVASMVFP